MILLDTQVVAWLAREPEKISQAAKDAIQKARLEDAGLAISDKTLWELAMMSARNHLKINATLREFLDATERLCVVIPVNPAIAERTIQFGDTFPSDPADRIIAATAIIYGMPLVTADAQIRKSGEVACIW
jgi:PIN domain nuclease of toxin-antitoxin system